MSLGVKSFGKYEIRKRIGGDARVEQFLAEHVAIQRTVEVRCLPDDTPADAPAASQLLREARVLGGATHRNLQGVVDSGRDELGRPYVVYESLRGQPLSELILRHPRGLDPQRAARIVVQILEAVRALHDAGVVLRTFRPDDAMVEATNALEDFVKIRCPMEAAMLFEGGARRLEPNRVSAYVAPEIARGERGIDPRADFYSVGIVLRELLTGKPVGDDQMLTDTARRALARACAGDPEDRFASADGFLQAVSLMLPTDRRPAREHIPAPDDGLSADLQYLHLRRTTRHGLTNHEVGEGHIELLPALLAIEAIYRRFGTEVWEDVCYRVEGADGLLPGAGNTPVHVERGVPVSIVSEILSTVDETAGSGDLSVVVELGEAVAQRGLTKMFPELPRPLVPSAIVDQFPYVWSRFSRDGIAQAVRTSDTSARLSIAKQSTPSLEISGLIGGFLREAIRLAGAEGVEVCLITAQALGDRRDLYTVEWY